MEIIDSIAKDSEVRSSSEEPLTYHRRGHWFESSTAHHCVRTEARAYFLYSFIVVSTDSNACYSFCKTG